MPAVAVAVAAAAAAAAASSAVVSAGLAVAGGFIAALAGGLAGSVVSLVGTALLPKPKPKTAFDPNAQGLLVSARNPIAPQRLVYGQVRVGGTVVFMASKGGSGSDQPNRLLYLVIALAGHEVEEIGDIYFDDQLVPLQASGAGYIPSAGRYSGTHSGTGEPWVYVEKYTGSADQAASSLLVGANVGWTTSHRGRGIAYLMLRLVNSVDIWPTGIPNVTAIVKGKKVYDPRTGQTAWSDNWALCLADYLTNAKFGLGETYASRIDEDFLIAAANTADEIVAVTTENLSGSSDGATLDVSLTTERTPRIGERYTISGGTYYCASVAGANPTTEGTRRFRLTFATSLSNARAGTTTSIPSGSVTAARTGEPRYTVNGVVSADRARREVLEELRQAGAGAAVRVGGKWRVLAGAWRVPTVTLDAGDLRGPIRIQTKLSQRDGGNGVRGIFSDPSHLWQPTDYPGVTNAAYVTADNGVENWRDLDLPFTASSSMAQRVAKVALERLRRPIAVVLPCKLSAWRVIAGDVVQLSLDRYGWSPKSFEVQTSRLVVDHDEGGNPFLGVDLSLRELDANAFVWSENDEAPLPAAPATTLPNPFDLAPPGVPEVTEALYETRGGRGVAAKAIMSWAAPEDAFVELYQPEYRLVGASSWTVMPRQESTTVEILDIAPGTYDFRVKAVNALGVSSAYATRRKEIVGLGARPADVTGLTAAVVSSIAVLQWDPHPDLDVRIGGYFRVRWSPAISGATWDTAVDVGDRLVGNVTLALVPAATGTYLVKAVDSTGNTSANAATVVVTEADHHSFTTLDTITESPTFSGAKSSVTVDDGVLHLTGNTLFDDIADFDAVENLDIEGGIAESGTYDFAAGYDHGSVGTHRISFSAAVAVVNTLDTVDSRGAPIDEWEDFDGPVTASGGVRFFVRQTDDDPGGDPTWGPWQRVSPIGDFRARAYQFRAELYVDDPAYDVEVSALSVTIKEV